MGSSGAVRGILAARARGKFDVEDMICMAFAAMKHLINVRIGTDGSAIRRLTKVGSSRHALPGDGFPYALPWSLNRARISVGVYRSRVKICHFGCDRSHSR